MKSDFADWHILQENLDMAYIPVFKMIFETKLLHGGLYGSLFWAIHSGCRIFMEYKWIMTWLLCSDRLVHLTRYWRVADLWLVHPTGDWRIVDLWIVRTTGHDMITAHGLISAPDQILEGSRFIDRLLHPIGYWKVMDFCDRSTVTCF